MVALGVALPSYAPTPPRYTLVDQYGDEYVMHNFQNIDAVVWRRTPTEGGVSRIGDGIPRRLKQTSSSRMSVIHVALAGTRMPDLDARAAFGALGQRWRSSIGCVVVVCEHAGFVASALRGLVTSALVLTGQRFTTRVAQHVGEAAAWLPEPHQRETGVAVDPAELYDVLTSIRSHYGRRAREGSDSE